MEGFEQAEKENWFEVIYGFLQKKEDIDRAFPHLRLSGEDRSDGSVGRT